MQHQTTEMAFKALIIAALIAAAAVEALPARPKQGYSYPRPWVNPKVVGGSDANPGSHPYIASLQWGWISGFSHFCAGVIITDTWILTAAHCVDAVPAYGDLIVKAGKHNINLAEANEQTRNVVASMTHPDYAGGVGPWDIGLMKLDAPLDLNAAVATIDLPAAGSIPTGNSILAGWGSTSTTHNPIMPDILQEVTLPLIDLVTCKESVEALTGPAPSLETNVCTGPLTGGFSACSGDSGGPLIQNNGGSDTLIGLVSWGIVPCGTVGAPSVYTRVSEFNGWIADKLAEN